MTGNCNKNQEKERFLGVLMKGYSIELLEPSLIVIVLHRITLATSGSLNQIWIYIGSYIQQQYNRSWLPYCFPASLGRIVILNSKSSPGYWRYYVHSNEMNRLLSNSWGFARYKALYNEFQVGAKVEVDVESLRWVLRRHIVGDGPICSPGNWRFRI